MKNEANLVSNVLVLLIGISEYDQLENLPGVPTDINNYRQLWHEEYGYDIYPTVDDKEWFGKKRWRQEEVIDFIEDGRELLVSKYNKRQLIYDSLMIIICGHGGNNVIYPSDYDGNKKRKNIAIQKLHAMVSGVWKQSAVQIPRLFIIDCCRDDEYGGYLIRGDQAIGHKMDLICSLYGNCPGVEVDENAKGGYFSQCLIKQFRNRNKSNTLTLSHLTRFIKRDLKQVSNSNQTVWKEGDPDIDDLVLGRRFEASSRSTRAGKDKLNVHLQSEKEEEVVSRIKVFQHIIFTKLKDNKWVEWLVINRQQIEEISAIYSERNKGFKIHFQTAQQMQVVDIYNMNTRQANHYHKLITNFVKKK